MFSFSPLEAAATGIGFVIRRPVWTLRFVLAASLLTFGYLQISQHLNVSALWALIGLVFVMIIASAIVNAAILRKLIRDEDGGPFTLQLGADEARLACVITAIAGGLAVVIASGLILSVVAASQAADFAVLMFGPEAKMAGAALVGSLTTLTIVWLAVYFGVRLSLAPAATIGQRRIALHYSWELTRDRVWPLLKAYLLSFLLVVVFLTAFGCALLAIWALLSRAGVAPEQFSLPALQAALKTYANDHALGSVQIAGAAAAPLLAAQALVSALGSIFPAGVGANAYLAFENESV